MTARTTPAQQADAAMVLQYEMTSAISEALQINETLASPVAAALVRVMRARLGGEEIYIPIPDKRERDSAVVRDFNGCNRDEVCRKHGISKALFYDILSRQKKSNER